MSFGLSSAGFLPKRFDDVEAELQDALRAELGTNLKFTTKSLFGVLVSILADSFADVWAQLENVYASAYPDSASGVALDNLIALADQARRAASYTTVDSVRLTGLGQTVIPDLSEIKDDLGNVYQIQGATTIPGVAGAAGQTIIVTAVGVVAGPIPALAGSLTTINTPVAGWTSVTNTADGTPGRSVASDAETREFFRLFMRAGGGTAVDALRAALLRLPDVTEAIVDENAAAEVDAEGRPPNCLEAIVRGGDDQQIVDTIWVGKPSAIPTYGNTSGTVLDGRGATQTVAFSRPVERSIYVAVDYEPDAAFPADGEDLIQTAILDYAATLQLGEDPIAIRFVQRIEVDGLLALTVRLGFVADPAYVSRLSIAKRELAVFDSSRIAFNRS